MALDLSTLKNARVQHYMGTGKEIPEEVATFVEEGYQRTANLKSGEWITLELEMEQDVKDLILVARRYCQRNGMSFMVNKRSQPQSNFLVYRVIDKITHEEKGVKS